MKIGQSSSSSSSSSSTSISHYPVALGLACFSHATSSPSPNPLHVPGTTLRTLRTPAAGGSGSGGSGGGRLARTLFSVRARCLFSENFTQADEMDENEAFHGEEGGGGGGGCHSPSGRYSTMEEFMNDLMGVFVDVLCTTDESLVALSSLWMLSQQQRLYEQQQQQQAQARGNHDANNDGEDGGMVDVDGNTLDDSDGDLPSSSSSSSFAEASSSATSSNSSSTSSSQHPPPVHIPDLLTHIRQVAHHITSHHTNHSPSLTLYHSLQPCLDGQPAVP